MSAPIDRNFIEFMTWDDVARRIDAGAVAILPIGAAAKQHGLHLPLNTDRIQVEWLAARLADHIDALIWPTVTYGYYPAFVDYAGSSSLSASAFRNVIQEISAGIFGHRCRMLFVLDSGISTRAPVERALAGLGGSAVFHLRIHEGPHYRRAIEELAEQSHGSHADELETSIMLAVAPHLVDMSRAEASPALKQQTPGRLTRSDAASPNYSRSGSYGDPTLATRAKGEVLLAAMLDDLVEQATVFIAGKTAPAKSSNAIRSSTR